MPPLPTQHLSPRKGAKPTCAERVPTAPSASGWHTPSDAQRSTSFAKDSSLAVKYWQP